MSNIAFIPYNFPFNSTPTPLGAFVFGGGINGSGSYVTSTTKYDYNADTWSNGAALINQRQRPSAVGNRVFGIITYGQLIGGGGSVSSRNTEKCYYAVDTIEQGTTLGAGGGVTNVFGGACGNATEGVWGCGNNNPFSDHYYYADDTTVLNRTNRHNPHVNRTSPGVAGIADMALWMAGQTNEGSGVNGRTSEKYYYSGDYWIANTVILATSASVGQPTCFGNNTLHITAAAGTAKRYVKYEYATDAYVAQSTMSNYHANSGMGASTETVGVIYGGNTVAGLYSTINDRYSFTSDTWVTAAAGLVGASNGFGLSDAPAHL